MCKEEELKEFLSKRCISIIKSNAIKMLQIRFRLTREDAIKVYDNWRSEYLKGDVKI